MNLPGASGVKGFTLVELFLVVGAVVFIAAFTLPSGMRFFQTQSLDEETTALVSAMRRARDQALFQKQDNAFGIKFLASSYVLFQGNSYALRVLAQDEPFSFGAGVSASGIDEIVFAKQTGIPSATGTITLTLGENTQSLSMNAQGVIEFE